MKTLIWPWPTRVLHWMMAVGFAVAYLTGGEEELLHFHVTFGVLAGVAALCRTLQGFSHTRHVRFIDFPLGISSLRTMLADPFQKKVSYAGHNPIASLVMIAILMVAPATVLLGILTAASEEVGFAGFHFQTGIDPDVFEEIHDSLATLFLILVCLHLTGLVADTVFHSRHRTVLSMITGYKHLDDEPARLSGFQRMLMTVLVVLPVLAAILVFSRQPAGDSESSNTPGTIEATDDDD